jgi:hypothetical protein
MDKQKLIKSLKNEVKLQTAIAKLNEALFYVTI